jgi:hypothetical protein
MITCLRLSFRPPKLLKVTLATKVRMLPKALKNLIMERVYGGPWPPSE